MYLPTLPEILTAVDVDGVPVIVGQAYENDNSTVSMQDDCVSVALALRGTSWVVTAFGLGADGEPDYDRELIFKSFERETIARWLYVSATSKLKRP